MPMTDGAVGGKPHVLIVDDMADVVELAAMLLRSCGYTVSTARAGAEALDVLERDPIQVAVIDLGLPDMDGSEVAMRIKQHDAWAHIRTIAVTGDAGADAVRDPASTGFDAHVVKPFSGTDLMATIDRVFGGT